MQKFSGKIFGKKIFIETADKKTALRILNLLGHTFDLDSIKTKKNTLVINEEEKESGTWYGRYNDL